MKDRIAAFDIEKGIAILLVIVGHNFLIPRWIPHWIYLFHMPLFFLLAGWFHKTSTDYKTVAVKSARRLLLPFGFITLLMVLYNLLSAIKYGNQEILTDQFIAILFPTGIRHAWMNPSGPPDIGAIWFLPALFWCKNVANYLLSKNMNRVFIIGFAIIATLIDRYLISLPFGILPGLSAMMFYIIGEYFSTRSIKIWLIVICMLCWIAAWFFSSVSMITCEYRFFPLEVFSACGATLAFWWFSSIIEQRMHYSGKVLAWLGRTSMAILCIHTLLRNCYILEHLPLEQVWYIQLPLEIMAIIAITWFCTRIPITRKIFGIAHP